jgi:hypothetical protein
MQTMHLLPGVAIQPNLELKTRPKQPLDSLPLVIALPAQSKRKVLMALLPAVSGRQAAASWVHLTSWKASAPWPCSAPSCSRSPIAGSAHCRGKESAYNETSFPLTSWLILSAETT